MVEYIYNLLGSYTPQTYEYIIDGTVVNIIPSGVSGLDWSFIFSGIIFCILINSLFKCLGGILCKIF